jgi:hypothetical protein
MGLAKVRVVLRRTSWALPLLLTGCPCAHVGLFRSHTWLAVVPMAACYQSCPLRMMQTTPCFHGRYLRPADVFALLFVLVYVSAGADGFVSAVLRAALHRGPRPFHSRYMGPRYVRPRNFLRCSTGRGWSCNPLTYELSTVQGSNTWLRWISFTVTVATVCPVIFSLLRSFHTVFLLRTASSALNVCFLGRDYSHRHYYWARAGTSSAGIVFVFCWVISLPWSCFVRFACLFATTVAMRCCALLCIPPCRV